MPKKVVGCVLAGGMGTRMGTLTRITNKHLLPVYNKPMIFYPIQTLVNAGIKDIMIITGPEHAGDFVNLLGNGEEFGAKITYGFQKKSGGIAEALSLCEDFVNSNPMVVILGDNIFQNDIRDYVEAYEKDHAEACVFLKEVPDPERFGVPTIVGNSITKITEKPTEPDTNYAVTGLYFYNPNVWEVIKSLAPSDRGELEITDVNNWYIRNKCMGYVKLDGYWLDVGQIDALHQAATVISNKHKKFKNKIKF